MPAAVICRRSTICIRRPAGRSKNRSTYRRINSARCSGSRHHTVTTYVRVKFVLVFAPSRFVSTPARSGSRRFPVRNPRLPKNASFVKWHIRRENHTKQCLFFISSVTTTFVIRFL